MPAGLAQRSRESCREERTGTTMDGLPHHPLCLQSPSPPPHLPGCFRGRVSLPPPLHQRLPKRKRGEKKKRKSKKKQLLGMFLQPGDLPSLVLGEPRARPAQSQHPSTQQAHGAHQGIPVARGALQLRDGSLAQHPAPGSAPSSPARGKAQKQAARGAQLASGCCGVTVVRSPLAAAVSRF